MQPGHPHDEYRRRLEALRISATDGKRRDNLLAWAKLVAGALIFVIGIWLARYRPAYLLAVLIPVAAFVALFGLHERILRLLRRSDRLKRFYEQAIGRLEDRWAGTGQQGDRFLDPSHPYARDLDLFGKGGLFELLSIARTRAGEETLAAWLLSPSSPAEIAGRQAAIRELAPRLDFRENLSLAGEDVHSGLRPEALLEWSETQPRLDPRLARVAAPVLAALWIFSLIGWQLWGWSTFAIVMSLLNLGLSYKFRAVTAKAAASVEEATKDLDLLAAILRLIEGESFATERLAQLQILMRPRGAAASHAVSGLNQRVAWVLSHDNLIVKVLDPFVFWTPQCVSAVEGWRVRYGSAVRDWLAAAGEMEALASLANYAYERPEDVFPEFVAHGPCFDAEAFAHPLLPRGRAVANDLRLDDKLQLIVISGPNMAGKSTFIRSVGINVVLAQAGAPVCARSLKISSLNVTASICVLDSLQGGLSRFYAEILRLKQIDELSRGPVPILFLLDELLSGTNSHDRRVGTESMVRSLVSRGAIGLVTTHDLALAGIAEKMGGSAANFHFEDRFEDGELHFDYRLTPGVVQTTNALELMRSIGIEVTRDVD